MSSLKRSVSVLLAMHTALLVTLQLGALAVIGNHPNLTMFCGAVIEPKSQMLIFDWVDVSLFRASVSSLVFASWQGKPLSDYVQDGGCDGKFLNLLRTDCKTLATCCRDVLAGLKYLHSLG